MCSSDLSRRRPQTRQMSANCRHAAHQLRKQGLRSGSPSVPVVGVRGVTDAAGIREAMEFLGIPSSQWSTILRKSAIASVEALEYLHKLRNSPQQFLPPELERTSVASGKRKRAGTTSTLERWRRLATDPVRRSFQDHGRTSTRQLGKRAHAGASRVRRGIS